MNKINFKLGAFAIAVSLVTLTSCEQENDELLTEDQASSKSETEFLSRQGNDCQTQSTNSVTPNVSNDKNSSINSKVDDRSCTYDYSQTGNYGRYRLNSANNPNSGLQTRIERTSKKFQFKEDTYQKITGTVKILNAGAVTDNKKDNEVGDGDGTYFAQVKGLHTNLRRDLGESRDPAILLFVAKPKRRNSGTGSIIKENGQTKEFKIYAEIVKKRGGSGSNRRMVYITTVRRDADFNVSIRSEFYTKNGTKRQRIKSNINGVFKSFEISTQNTRTPNPQKAEPTETRIRMGAYRCRGGRADILWKSLKLTSGNI